MSSVAMTIWPLIAVRADASVVEAAAIMCNRSVGALGVFDDDHNFVGLVTERDVAWIVAQGKVPAGVTVREAANDFPVIVDAPVSRRRAAAEMMDAHIRHLVVRDGDELGIISLRDVVKAEQEAVIARDVMTAPCVTCRVDARILEVAEALAEGDISGMPVVDEGGAIVGVISERDLAHAIGGPLVRLAVRRPAKSDSGGSSDLSAEGVWRAGDLMSSPPITIAPDASLTETAALMAGENVNRLPVVEDRIPVGIVTRGDLLRAFGS